MMDNVNYTIVGIFVLTLVSAIVLSIIWLSSGFSAEEKFTTYAVYMNEAVTGLNIQSPVKYEGVDVGFVKNIELDIKKPQQITLLLSIKIGTPITQATTATLNTQGITGISYIGLQSNTQNTNPLLAKPGEKYPVIPSSPSLLVRLDTVLTNLTVNLNQITRGFNSLLNPQNLLAFNQSLLNFNRITTMLAANTTQLNQIINNTTKATQEFPVILQSSQAMVQTLTTQTLPAANQMMNNLNAATSNLLSTSAAIKQNPAILVRGKAAPARGPGE